MREVEVEVFLGRMKVSGKLKVRKMLNGFYEVETWDIVF